jgi:FkbM family methyltransferase
LLDFLKNFLYVFRSIWNDPSNHGQRGKRILMFAGWQLWKRIVHLPIVVPTDNRLRFIAYPESDVSAGFIYYRVPDGEDIAFLRSHLRGGVFLDIGANVGSVSLLLADLIDTAILFEPNPVAAARARENIALNRLPFEVHELAISDVEGTVEFEDAGGAAPCNRAVVGFVSQVPTRTVQRVTIDEFLRGRLELGEIAAVKIDVEGHENSVLRGMKRLLQEGRPKLIMFEYLERTNLSEARALFEGVSYKAFELTANGPAEIQGPVRPLQNLFACPQEIFSAMSKRPS